MAVIKVNLLFSVFLHAILLLSSLVHCDEENSLLDGLNSYRKSLHLPPLAENEMARCLTDKVAEKLEEQPCTNAHDANMVKLDNYPELLSNCDININQTRDGVVLPVCGPNLDPNLVLTNYTRTAYSKYLSDSRFTAAGVGSGDEWTVVILSTNTTGGRFAGENSLVSEEKVKGAIVSSAGHRLTWFHSEILMGFIVKTTMLQFIQIAVWSHGGYV